MTLNELEQGDSATIIAINADKELKNRLFSFGLMKGETISVKKRSLAKSTIEVSVNRTHIAIRSSEAEKIEVSN